MSFPTSPTNGQQATVNGIVYNYNSTKGAWIKNVTTAGTLTSGNLVLTSNTASTNTTTGALIVTGGVGVSGNILVGNRIGIGGTPTSSLTVIGLARICDANSYLLFRNAADSTSNGVMQFPDSGDASIVQYRDADLTLGTNNTTRIRIANGGNVVVVPTTTSTSTTTGALVVSGGIGVAGNVNLAGNLQTATRGITKSSMPAGTILQVVHTTKTNTFSGTSVLDNGGYFIDVTGLSASITPTSSTSKILVILDMYIGVTATSSGYQQSYRLKRTIGASTTFPILGDVEGGRPQATGRINMYKAASDVQYNMGMMSGTHQDSPATTSSITYQVQLGGYSSSPIVFVNRASTFQALANDYDTVPVSTLTLMEVAV